VSEPVYQFREGSRFRGDAAAVAAELERIRTECGALRSEVVVTEAEPDGAPLHPYFEWDDSAAAHSHRLMQARTLVRAVVVMVEGHPPASMYVHVSPDTVGAGDYQPLARIVTMPDRYLSALAEAQRELVSAQRRVSELLDVARTTGHKEGEVARIMLAVQALATANEAIIALH
jgi:hypothetical protein